MDLAVLGETRQQIIYVDRTHPDAAVADAIEDHYKPRFAGDALPRNHTGTVLALAEQTLAAGDADLFSMGRPFIANPDLVARLEKNAPLNEPDRATFYGGGAAGYTTTPRCTET